MATAPHDVPRAISPTEADSNPAPPVPAAGAPAPARSLTAIALAVLGLTTAVVLMLLAFVGPAINSGPHDLPLAVSGPASAVEKVVGALDAKQPGAFAVTRVDTADQAADLVHHHDAVGAISLGEAGVTIQTATAAGAPYAPLLKGVGAGLQAQGQKVTYTELAPYPQGDPTGVGLNALALPLAFGGMASAGVLSAVVKGGTHRSRTARRTVGSLIFSVLAGLAAAAVLQFGFGTLAGDYWAEAGVFALGIAGISLTVLALESMLGFPGLGLGGVVMIFVANPLSGMSTGAAWLPAPWGTIGQLFPIGAAGTAIRSLGYFDGAGMTFALGVLIAWALLGLLLTRLAAGMRSRSERTGAMAAAPSATTAL